MNKKMISILVVALSLVSLSLAAFAPMNIDAVELDRRGGPGTGTGTTSDGTCDQECTGDGQSANAGMYVNPQGQGSGNFGAVRGSGVGLGELTEAEAEGLVMAIEEEYKARALYEYVMDTFGEISPFVEIAASEAQHASVLIRQADKYGIEYPAYDPAAFNFPVFSTIDEALQAGVDAEIEDAALYDDLMATTDRVDLLRVYNNLQSASLNNHLVSFQDYLAD